MPEIYLGSWVLISVNAQAIVVLRSSGGKVICRIEFMMISRNSLESKCDQHKFYNAFTSFLTLSLGPAQYLTSTSKMYVSSKTIYSPKKSRWSLDMDFFLNFSPNYLI